jgi:hypothetical protein
MWWTRPRLTEFRPLLPANILDVLLRAYAVVEVGGLSGTGPDRGRNFERLFYTICERRRVALSEKAGSRTLVGRRSASGFNHEVDGASRGMAASTMWELKHLSSPLEKNELLIFNGKGLDFLQGGDSLTAKMPLLRFLMSGGNIRDDCRRFALLWGITVIEPGRVPLPILYEAAARGLVSNLNAPDQDAIRFRAPWAFRALQAAVSELAHRVGEQTSGGSPVPVLGRRVSELLDIQEQLGAEMLDSLDERWPDWVDDLAHETWIEVGGW